MVVGKPPGAPRLVLGIGRATVYSTFCGVWCKREVRSRPNGMPYFRCTHPAHLFRKFDGCATTALATCIMVRCLQRKRSYAQLRPLGPTSDPTPRHAVSLLRDTTLVHLLACPSGGGHTAL